MDLPLMVTLNEDHRAIRAVCAVIADHLPALEAGDEAAAALIQLALEYLRDYPEWHHHPREEHLFTLAIDKDPLLARVLDEVREEHDATPGDTQALIDLLDQSRDRAANARVAAGLKLYVEEQRKHIVREDRDIFPRLRGLLPASAWALPPASSRPEDPLTGGGPAGRFAPLRAAAGVPVSS
jgi:hemerythrin-like domain-containing protein